jgi:hypothetical protein
MKIAGFFLLVAGWVIVIAALALLRSVASRDLFILVGVSIQILGVILVVHSHRQLELGRG